MMTKITIGTLRSIDLFSENDAESKAAFGNLITVIPGIKQSDSLHAIGAVNGMYPLVKDHEKGAIYVASAIENKLIRVASSQTELDAIIKGINGLWTGHENEMFLPRNEEIMKKYKHLQNEWDKTIGKTVDLGWWKDFAFKELNVHYK